jgi:hypothetical protein
VVDSVVRFSRCTTLSNFGNSRRQFSLKCCNRHSRLQELKINTYTTCNFRYLNTVRHNNKISCSRKVLGHSYSFIYMDKPTNVFRIGINSDITTVLDTRQNSLGERSAHRKTLLPHFCCVYFITHKSRFVKHFSDASPNIIRVSKSTRMIQADHAARIEMRNAYKILVGIPERKRPLRRTRRR